MGYLRKQSSRHHLLLHKCFMSARLSIGNNSSLIESRVYVSKVMMMAMAYVLPLSTKKALGEQLQTMNE